MIKVLQFGEGNFLRTFVEHYFDTLNEEGMDYKVIIVKPISFGSVEKFKKQKNRYHIVLRGMQDGRAVENVREIRVLEDVVDPFLEQEKYEKIILDPEIRIIVSNTTEAGICYNGEDKMDGFDGITYPAKLTKLLYARFQAGLGGLYLMPVELIDNNADALSECVHKYIKLWALPAAFEEYVDKQIVFCNTLVDRIVSGHPKTDADRAHLTELIGETDELVSVGEPFGLWAVENKGDISSLIPAGHHGIDVVLPESIKMYKKQKVRVLNGSHTNLVATGLVEGAVTVYDCMKNEKLRRFVCETLDEEIIPFVSDDYATVRAFSDAVLTRFENPYLNHLLISISLNSVSKWSARDLPSFKDYYEKYGKIPAHLTVGFSYLMYLYSSVKKEEGGYFAPLKNTKVEVKDEASYLSFFADGGTVREFMSKADVFGEDLTGYENFAEMVEANIATLRAGESLI